MDYVDKAKRYITKVLDGKIPACRWVKFACLRQKQDLEGKKAVNFHITLTAKELIKLASSLSAYVTSRDQRQENVYILRIGNALSLPLYLVGLMIMDIGGSLKLTLR